MKTITKTILVPPPHRLVIRPGERSRLKVEVQRNQDGWYGYTVSYVHNGYLIYASEYAYGSSPLALDAGASYVTKLMKW